MLFVYEDDDYETAVFLIYHGVKVDNNYDVVDIDCFDNDDYFIII